MHDTHYKMQSHCIKKIYISTSFQPLLDVYKNNSMRKCTWVYQTVKIEPEATGPKDLVNLVFLALLYTEINLDCSEILMNFDVWFWMLISILPVEAKITNSERKKRIALLCFFLYCAIFAYQWYRKPNTRFSTSAFLWIRFPSPGSQSIPLGSFKIFTKIRRDYSQFCVYCRCQRHRQQIIADVVVTGD